MDALHNLSWRYQAARSKFGLQKNKKKTDRNGELRETIADPVFTEKNRALILHQLFV